ncbi:hypothetical protein BD311DRAFT_654503 [Dichomitus squalens]|uniref:Macrofage activating glyco protein n=1 Tax=Dichomitus squalens TaxID=114155 RepID=A0A4Q9PKA0_9APHY|nr:hypothetical protein BD311DRAFT_654503 [Dichomitus squalens]TBU54542.1 hypothetical protein BD310DRAFT_1041708 [Dichomitus squalens]
MASYAPSVLFALLSATTAAAQGLTWAPTPLVDQHYPTPSDAPPKVWPDTPAYERGPQTGYNQCNSTTEGQDSLCQTMYFNGLDDFCLWAPPQPNTTIADAEGEVVAWCTKKGYGTRIMTEGTIKGAQLLKSNDYWMLTGIIDQTKLYIQDGDYGGELDSGSQDGRGNPIGGLVYSTAFNTSVYQVNWWTEFIGNNQFCIKICNPDSPNQSGYCQHTLDRIGLGYNCPSKYTVGGGYQEGEFEVCDTQNMAIVGEYTDASGATQSYAQPAESLGPITTVPYQPTTVASSNCQQTASSVLFSQLLAGSGTTSGAAPTGSAGASGSQTGTASGSKVTGSTASGSKSSTGASPSATGNGASPLAAGSAISAVVGALALAAFL